ncbi:hypothetical protein NDU88_003953 [Pleurodeles waltl]|uniref:Secreted protein n=1 Tax=Pleurodeles waltl TaxID=8319 RepID=A0AAV7MTE8_PLEWA|nr:hypothetical protein NDU88_003953 [Pleurodeles waltl]
MSCLWAVAVQSVTRRRCFAVTFQFRRKRGSVISFLPPVISRSVGFALGEVGGENLRRTEGMTPNRVRGRKASDGGPLSIALPPEEE